MNQDRYGLPLTTVSATAAAAYRDGVDRLLSAWHGAGAAFDRAIAADPEFALGHIARARVHQVYAEIAEARAAAARARSLASKLPQRERDHVDVLALIVEGQGGLALAGAEAHLEAFPRDALVLSVLLGAFGLYAFSGRADHDAARVALCERHARHYREDWWFLTYLGWSYTEAGRIAEGRALTERGLELRRENGNAAHALAHALFEQGEREAGMAFLADWLPGYDRAGVLNGHLSWHAALLALEQGDLDAALRLYEDRIGPAVSVGPPLNVFTDSTSLLWRLHLRGRQELASHWSELVEYGNRTFPKAGAHFADAHWALLGAALREEAFDERLAELERLAASGKLAPGRCLVDLCRGVRAFAEGDYESTIRLLEPLLPEVVRIGGSHAQRELFEDTLIVACLRAQAGEKARDLLQKRLRRRPSRSDELWLQQAVAPH